MWWGKHQLVFVVLAFPLIAGCIDESPPSSGSAVDGTAPDEAGLIGTWVQNASWSAEWQGDLAIRLSIVSPEDVVCRWQWGVWGISEDLRPTAGQFVSGLDGSISMKVGRGQGNPADLDAHVSGGDTLDEQAFQGPRSWADGTNWTYELKADQEANFTFFATGLTVDNASRSARTDHFFPPGYEEANVHMRIACKEPVLVSRLGVGKDVVVFDETSFRGGATAHAYGGLEATGASVASRVGADLSTEHGLLFVKVWGDIFGNHVSAGVIETEFPGGGDVLMDHPTQYIPTCGLELPGCPFVSKYYEAGPGPYGVSATYASVDVTGLLEGAIVGLDPVDRLPLQRMV